MHLDLEISRLEIFSYDVNLSLGAEEALFSFHPFEEPHLWKFTTLEGRNSAAENVLDVMDPVKDHSKWYE